MLSIAVELRLNFDLFQQGQSGMVSVMDDVLEEKVETERETAVEIQKQSQTTSTFSKQQMQLLERFYYTALPFHKKVNKFYDSQSKMNMAKMNRDRSVLDEQSSDIHSFFSQESFFDDSSLAKAIINTRFLRHQETIDHYIEAIEALEEKFGRNHPSVAAALNNLGGAYGSLGDHKQQIKYHKESLKIREKIFGRNNPSVGEGLHNLGGVYVALGEYKQAMEHFEESKKIFSNFYNQNHPYLQASIKCYNVAKEMLLSSPQLTPTMEYQLPYKNPVDLEIKSALVKKHQGKIVKEGDSGFITIQIESNLLTKDLRKQLGLTRSLITKVTPQKRQELQDTFQTITIEDDKEKPNAIFITFDDNLTKEIESLVKSWSKKTKDSEPLSPNPSLTKPSINKLVRASQLEKSFEK